MPPRVQRQPVMHRGQVHLDVPPPRRATWQRLSYLILPICGRGTGGGALAAGHWRREVCIKIRCTTLSIRIAIRVVPPYPWNRNQIRRTPLFPGITSGEPWESLGWCSTRPGGPGVRIACRRDPPAGGQPSFWALGINHLGRSRALGMPWPGGGAQGMPGGHRYIP